MKQLKSLTFFLMFAVLLVGCSSGDSSGGGGRQFLSLGSAPTGGTFFIIGGAISEVLNDNRGDQNWQVTAEATRGSQENIRRLDSGEIDLALSNAAISYFAARGEASWDKPHNIRVIMTLAPNVAMFVAPADGPVQNVPDLKGRRVVIGPAGAGFDQFVRPLLEAHGVDYDELSVLHSSQTAAVDLLADGSAAAAFLGGGVPTASITQAAATRDILLVPYDDAAKESALANYPFFGRAVIKANTYRGQGQDYHGLDVGSMHLITSTAQSEELIYNITRAIYEHREQVTQKHAAGRAINPNNVVRDTGVEFHPGAVRYYREIGIWPEN